MCCRGRVLERLSLLPLELDFFEMEMAEPFLERKQKKSLRCGRYLDYLVRLDMM